MGAAEHPAIGEAAHRLLVKPPSRCYGLHKLVVARINQALQQLAFPFAEGAIRRKNVFVEAALDGFKAHAQPLQQLGEVVAPQNHADRAGDRAWVGHNFFGGNSDVDPA